MGLFNKADKASTEALSKRGESHLAPRTFNMTIGGLEKALLKEFPAEDVEKWDSGGGALAARDPGGRGPGRHAGCCGRCR